jgi:putative resolvase
MNNEEFPKYYKPKELCDKWKVSDTTLRAWHKQGKVDAIKTEGGHRRYVVKEAQTRHSLNKRRIIYARVSSSKQQEDLDRQIAALKTVFPEHEVVFDVASGINFKRKGFRKLLELLFNGVVEEVVVAHRDRFTRFGFELFEWIFEKHGAILKVVENKCPEEDRDMLEDIMSIITVFTAKFYGKRKYRIDNCKKNKDLPQQTTKTVFQ